MALTCPRCGQGTVASYVVSRLGVRVQVCDECEALWADVVSPGPSNFQDFTDYMEQRGCPALWAELAEDGS